MVTPDHYCIAMRLGCVDKENPCVCCCCGVINVIERGRNLLVINVERTFSHRRHWMTLTHSSCLHSSCSSFWYNLFLFAYFVVDVVVDFIDTLLLSTKTTC